MRNLRWKMILTTAVAVGIPCFVLAENSASPRPTPQDADARLAADRIPGEGPAGQPHPGMPRHERPMVKGAYLGISARPAPQEIRAQFKLAEGTALLIDEVVADSPAAKAGLKKFDVLTKVDDQLIINPEQLAVLIRTHKPSDEVKLSIIHEAAASTVSAALVEKELPSLDGGPGHDGPRPGGPGRGGLGHDGPGHGGPEGLRGMHGMPGFGGMHGLGMRGGEGGPMGMMGRGGFGMHGGMEWLRGMMGMHGRGGPMGPERGGDMQGPGGRGGPDGGRGGFGPRGGNEEGPGGPMMGGRRGFGGFGGFGMRGGPGGGPDGDGGPDEDGPRGPGMHRRGFGPPHGPGGPTTKPAPAGGQQP